MPTDYDDYKMPVGGHKMHYRKKRNSAILVFTSIQNKEQRTDYVNTVTYFRDLFLYSQTLCIVS